MAMNVKLTYTVRYMCGEGINCRIVETNIIVRHSSISEAKIKARRTANDLAKSLNVEIIFGYVKEIDV